jgi:predicted nucleic acid-binding protein
MTGSQIVLIDSNVLYSRTLRDWVALLHSKSKGSVFRARYTEDIMAEVIYRLRRNHPDWPGQILLKIRQRLEGAFEGCLVEKYEIDSNFLGKDPHDAHVHSAALACKAHMLLTSNGKDFLPSGTELDTLAYEVWTPDDFLMLVNETAPELVREVISFQLAHFMKDGDEVDLPGALRKAESPNFALCVAHHLQTISIPPAKGGRP